MSNAPMPKSPPPRRSLKRSASTASLLTPPRTHRRFARGRSRGSCDSDSDGDNAILSSDEEEEHASKPHKKRRTDEKTSAAQEDAFWLSTNAELGRDGSEAGPSTGAEKDNNNPRGRVLGAPLLYRKRVAQLQQQQQERLQQQQQVDVTPVSPPPSNRKQPVLVASTPEADDHAEALTPSPPVTPKPRSKTRKIAPPVFRDSPDNPFLESPEVFGRHDTATPSPATADDESPKPRLTEQPTITYVFRGVRRVYQNPLYNHAESKPYSPPPSSRLPIDHPDYSPGLNVTPKLLFPEARRNPKRGKGKGTAEPAAPPAPAASSSKSRGRALSWDSSDEEEEEEIKPKKLNFGVAKAKGRTNQVRIPIKSSGAPRDGAAAKTLAEELMGAGEPGLAS